MGKSKRLVGCFVLSVEAVTCQSTPQVSGSSEGSDQLAATGPTASRDFPVPFNTGLQDAAPEANFLDLCLGSSPYSVRLSGGSLSILSCGTNRSCLPHSTPGGCSMLAAFILLLFTPNKAPNSGFKGGSGRDKHGTDRHREKQIIMYQWSLPWG